RRRFDDALFDGGHELARDCPAEDLVDELEAAAARQRLHLDLAVAKLAVPARLLLMPPLRIRLAANGLAVGNFRRLQRDLGVITLLEAAYDGLDVGLACAGNEELVGLRIAEEADKQILFHELVDGGCELVLVGAALRL